MTPRTSDQETPRAKFPARVVVSVLFVACLFGMMAGELRSSAKTYYEDMKAMGKKVPLWKYSLGPIAFFVKTGQNLFFCRFVCADLYGGIARVCGKEAIFHSPTDGHQRTDDGFIYKYSGPLQPLPSAKTSMPLECIEQIRELKDYLETRGIQFLYLIPPGRECLESPASLDPLEIYKQSSSYAERQRMIEFFEDNNINYFDVFREFSNNAPSLKDWFYRTDHHWKIERVFEMMPSLADNIRDTLHLGWPNGKDIFNKDRFREVQYPQFFIGSIGRRDGRFFVPPDDLIFYLPTFDTDYSINIMLWDGNQASIRGNFEETLFHRDYVEPKSPYGTNRYLYYVYCDKDYSLQLITNNNAKEGRVLILKDSMGIPISTFLSVLSHEIIMVDLRYQKGVGNLYEVIEKYQPDIVLVVYWLGDYRDVLFNFH